MAALSSGALRCVAACPRAPALREHTGQAPQPCLASTRSATAICSARLAWWADGANWPPPKPRQVDGENCRPPWYPLPVLMFHRPPLSHCATRSQVEFGAAVAAGATATSGAPAMAPASAVRAMLRPVLLGARWRPR